MARKIREADELIGKRLIVCESLLIPRKNHHRYAFFRQRECKVVRCKINKSGELIAIYVVKTRSSGWIDRKKPLKWMKTPIRISVEYLNWPIRRTQIQLWWKDEGGIGRYYDPPRFKWKWEILHPWRIENKSEDDWWATQAKVTMDARQRGNAPREWKSGVPTVAWWLNNENLIEQPVKKRYSKSADEDSQM